MAITLDANSKLFVNRSYHSNAKMMLEQVTDDPFAQGSIIRVPMAEVPTLIELLQSQHNLWQQEQERERQRREFVTNIKRATNKIEQIREVRNYIKCGLREAKEIVEALTNK